MASPVSLSTIAALALAGVGSGLYLGKSAVAEIDPVYFSSPFSASKFHADLVPGATDFDAPAPQLQAAAYVEGLGDGCVLCPPPVAAEYQVRDYGTHYEEGYASYVSAPADDVIEDAQEAIRREARRAALQEVERYAHFQVSSDEKPLRLASADAEEEVAVEEPAPDADPVPAEEEIAPAS
ncbi:MAG TPA: hypothetical protein VGD10_06485 [Allosphingosinicella sp.]|uniref:hypothetical protein n=1 Tax=Allosphingosinicella sp. TaxID=2823234 RepID=UPI002EDB2A82